MKWLKKNKFTNTMRVAGITKSVHRDGIELERRVKVLKIKQGKDKDDYVFKVPFGLDPSEVKKKSYVFKQAYGANHELKEENGVYVLSVYKDAKNNAYDFDINEIPLKGNLPILAGKDVLGNFHSFDMVKNPHLLIAGETGSGKSVMLRNIITSLILHKRHGLEMYLADMKRSEFHLFRNIDNVKAVMTKREDLLNCVMYLKEEMEKRGDLLDGAELAHIDDYNKQYDTHYPYLLLCIDEVALLKNDDDIMNIVEDISAIGRALGVFLILSMQRPDRDVLDGKLKNNLTVRYAFRSSDKVNSDIVLGRGSRDDSSQIKVNEKGKFLCKLENVTELQAPYLSLEKAKALISEYKVPIRKEVVYEKPQEDKYEVGFLEGE